MKIIIIKKCGLGLPGKVLEVKSGYANNFLFPQQLAVVASTKNLADWEAKLKSAAKEIKVKEVQGTKLINKLQRQKVDLTLKANEQGHLYAAVAVADLVVAIKQQLKIDLVDESVELRDIIKTIGLTTAILKVNGQDVAIKINIKASA